MKPQLYIWLSVILLISGLSSCHTSVYQYVWQRAKVVDEAWFQSAEAEIDALYEEGGGKAGHEATLLIKGGE